jgi:hypothetical protein
MGKVQKSWAGWAGKKRTATTAKNFCCGRKGPIFVFCFGGIDWLLLFRIKQVFLWRNAT